VCDLISKLPSTPYPPPPRPRKLCAFLQVYVTVSVAMDRKPYYKYLVVIMVLFLPLVITTYQNTIVVDMYLFRLDFLTKVYSLTDQ
jgi:hypothetical protein